MVLYSSENVLSTNLSTIDVLPQLALPTTSILNFESIGSKCTSWCADCALNSMVVNFDFGVPIDNVLNESADALFLTGVAISVAVDVLLPFFVSSDVSCCRVVAGMDDLCLNLFNLFRMYSNCSSNAAASD